MLGGSGAGSRSGDHRNTAPKAMRWQLDAKLPLLQGPDWSHIHYLVVPVPSSLGRYRMLRAHGSSPRGRGRSREPRGGSGPGQRARRTGSEGRRSASARRRRRRSRSRWWTRGPEGTGAESEISPRELARQDPEDPSDGGLGEPTAAAPPPTAHLADCLASRPGTRLTASSCWAATSLRGSRCSRCQDGSIPMPAGCL